MDTGTPERFGPYLVHRELGRGGMGVVYEAFDVQLGRRVAVKALHIETRNSAVSACEVRLYLPTHPIRSVPSWGTSAIRAISFS